MADDCGSCLDLRHALGVLGEKSWVLPGFLPTTRNFTTNGRLTASLLKWCRTTWAIKYTHYESIKTQVNFYEKYFSIRNRKDGGGNQVFNSSNQLNTLSFTPVSVIYVKKIFVLKKFASFEDSQVSVSIILSGFQESMIEFQSSSFCRTP